MFQYMFWASTATTDATKKTRYREKIEEYLKRAEELKKHVQQEKEGLSVS